MSRSRSTSPARSTLRSIPAIEFRAGWQVDQQGVIERGGRLRINYDATRLTRCFETWRGTEFGDIRTYVRFHPGGQIATGSLIAPVFDQENPPGIRIGHRLVPLELAVPGDATHAEIWFHNSCQTTSRCDAWDSRFGENYWFQIGGPPPRVPRLPVSYRSGAVTRPDIVNVLEKGAKKINAFPTGGTGSDLQTMLNVVAWVKETRYGANAWIDVHVFDSQDELIHSQTLTLPYTGTGSDFQYGFRDKVYQGSTATPGSVQPRPDARKIQYRLYYEVNHHIFTDGILHEHEVQQDAMTH